MNKKKLILTNYRDIAQPYQRALYEFIFQDVCRSHQLSRASCHGYFMARHESGRTL